MDTAKLTDFNWLVKPKKNSTDVAKIDIPTMDDFFPQTLKPKKGVVAPKNNPRKRASGGEKKKGSQKKFKMNPLEHPFYRETGKEWTDFCVDLEQLDVIRSMWHFPAACHLLWMLQTPLRLKVLNSLREYEVGLLFPESSPLMEETMTKLLLPASRRTSLNQGIGLPYTWWNQQLLETYASMVQSCNALRHRAGLDRFVIPENDLNSNINRVSSDDERDDERDDDDDREDDLTDREWTQLSTLNRRLEIFGSDFSFLGMNFDQMDIPTRIKLLYNLCEIEAEKPMNEKHLREMEEDDLRVESLGIDRNGHAYYYFPQFYHDRRIYRLSQDSSSSSREWNVWARGSEAFHAMKSALCPNSKIKLFADENTLAEYLEMICGQFEEERSEHQRLEQRANRKAILEAMPRKRSARIQVKVLDEFHQQSQSSNRSLNHNDHRAQAQAQVLAQLAKDKQAEERRLEPVARESQKKLGQDQAKEDLERARKSERELRADQRQRSSSSPGPMDDDRQEKMDTDRRNPTLAIQAAEKLLKESLDHALPNQKFPTRDHKSPGRTSTPSLEGVPRLTVKAPVV